MGIVEVMIGIVIGMIDVLAIYNIFAVAEGYKRTTVGAADAQTTGLFAQFTLAREIDNAGNGLSGDGAGLATCVNGDPNWKVPPGFFATAGTRAIRPLPAIIKDGGSATQSDSLIVTYSSAPRVVAQMLIVDKAMAATTDPIYVQSPNGFKANDLVIANDMAGNCEITTATSVTPGDSVGNVTSGIVAIAHAATTNLYPPGGTTNGPSVLNLGQDPKVAGATPTGLARRTYFDIDANNQLRTTDLFAGTAATPIAQNVVLLKAQYGVDCLSNGVITWTSATNNDACGDGILFRPDDFAPVAPGASAWTSQSLARVHLIRIAVVVRSDEKDFSNPPDPKLQGQTAWLFDCSTHNAACQGRMQIDNTVLIDSYRHRIYETIVPMRNAIFNNGT